jgi:hypothetical protein
MLPSLLRVPSTRSTRLLATPATPSVVALEIAEDDLGLTADRAHLAHLMLQSCQRQAEMHGSFPIKQAEAVDAGTKFVSSHRVDTYAATALDTIANTPAKTPRGEAIKARHQRCGEAA